MKSTALFLNLFIISICFCQNKTIFKVPVIKQLNKSENAEFHEVDSMKYSWTVFLGKFKFSETITLNEDNFSYNNIVYSKYAKSYIKEGTESDSLSLDSDGFQIFTDYNTSIVYSYDSSKPAKYFYPVYIVNETSHPKYFSFKRSAVFAIQEVNIKGKYGVDFWCPIEAKFVNFIASGYRTARVDPGEFVMFLMPKYNGSQISPMRVRLRLGENIIISKAFLGKYNPDQTIMEAGEDLLPKPSLLTEKEIEMIGGSIFTIQWLFNGAMPKEYNFIDK